MGKKIVERITTNPLGLKSVHRSRFIKFDVNGRRKSSNKLSGDKEEVEEGAFIIRSMDRFIDKQNAESIRHTMQAQEDTFTRQVRELHRVYNTQKMMMEQLKRRSQYWSTTINKKDQTGSRERTGSCSGIELENVVRTTKTTTEHMEESDLELTLSLGLSSSSNTMKKTNRDMDYSSTTSLRSSSDNCNDRSNINNINNNNNNNQESSGPNTPISSSSTTSLDLDKKRPHWLFQGLSINRTS